MKFRVFLAVATALFCQALFARSLAPLEKSQTGERTNHPVLFVSGLGSNASGTWGAKGTELYCETPELLMDVAPKVVSYEWINEFRGVTAGLNPHKKYIGKFIPTVAYPYRCSNMIDTLYSGEIVLEPLDIRYNRKISQDTLNHSRPQPYVLGEVTRAKNEDITLPYGAHRVKSYSEKFDFGKFWLIVGGEKLSADRILPDMSYEEMKDFLKPFIDADDISDVYVCFMNCITSKPQLTKKAYIALLKRTGINLMADSLLARSRAIMAERENSMAAQHPDGDREQTFDFPTSYKSNGIPYAIAHTLKIPAQNMNANFAKTTNGLYFFNAKTRCHASSHANVGADCDALEEWANPRWDTSFENYGQPNQLLDKMVRSLDDFYGKDAWHDDTNAVIDIVAHSQGGLITRIAIDKSRSPNGRNPVNHINRVITSTPRTMVRPWPPRRIG